MTFGEKIRNFREDKELTQSELGQILHMSQRKISYIEQGKCEPSLDDIKAFCLFFDVSSDYLIGLTNNYKHL